MRLFAIVYGMTAGIALAGVGIEQASAFIAPILPIQPALSSCSGFISPSRNANGGKAAVLGETAAHNTVRLVETWLSLPTVRRRIDTKAMQKPLNKATAECVRDLLVESRRKELAVSRRKEVAERTIVFGSKKLRWEEKTFGAAPVGGHSLWISLHGGGETTGQANDIQWRNQTILYQPEEGVYLAPRAPTNTWNMWHEAHIDPMLQRLIEDQVVFNGVNPNKVYLIGYSAGGDGVWQLAPRMADRFAAAGMMAGHPGDAALSALRNLPFGIFMGGEDSEYDRNRLAASKAAELTQLQRNEPSAYVHLLRIYEGLPHWMNGREKEGLSWMARFTRENWPRKIVWVQDDVPAEQFYWLQLPRATALRAGGVITASIDRQTITLMGDVPPGLIINLSDDLIDLDQPVILVVNGKVVTRSRVKRTAEKIEKALMQRFDHDMVAFASISVPNACDGLANRNATRAN